MLWVDNFYRLRVESNPSVGYCPLSCSVGSVLVLPRAVQCTPPVRLRDLYHAHPKVFDALMEVYDRLTAQVDMLTSHRVHGGSIRVPLDVLRSNVVPPQWRPFELSELHVSQTDEFISLLEVSRTTILSHVRRPLPLLIDVNLYHRFLRLSYGQGYVTWNFAKHMQLMPPVFGIWNGKADFFY